MRVEARRAPPIWHGTTEVEVRFRSVGDEGTDVELEHRGFESLGAAAARRATSSATAGRPFWPRSKTMP